MSSIILASTLVPLMIVMAVLLVDRIDQRTKESQRKLVQKDEQEERRDPPNDLIDLSGGMYGI